MSGKRPADALPGQPAKLQKNEAGRPIDPMAMIMAKKAEIQAKLAARAAAAAGQAPPAPIASASLAGAPSPGGLPARPLPTAVPAAAAAAAAAGGGAALDPTSLAAKVAAARARLLATTAAMGMTAHAPLVTPATAPSSARPGALSGGGGGLKKERNDEMPRGGLTMGIHPSLLEPASAASALAKDKGRTTMAPKFTSLKANARNASGSPGPGAGLSAASGSSSSPAGAVVNPYLAAAETAEDELSGPKRKARDFKFVQKGRYVQLGDQLRADASMEALKARIAASARKAGMDTEFDSLEKLVKREPPPVVEWWDELLLGAESYDVLEQGTSQVDNPQGPITYFVQHPVQILPPWEKRKVEPQALKLTKKESKKMRKQRRMADLKDRQDRVRMGLIPPDPPKVSLKNLMKVLANDAILDPTQVEAKVRRQVENRRLGHERMNEKRKLTPDARRDKVEKGKEKEEAKGLFGAVFRVRYLSNPQHKFKVRRNAEQNNLTGCCIFNPKFCLVYVEGSAKAVKFYKRVMLVRIDWTESARPLAGEDEDAAPPPTANKAEGEPEENMDDNRCDLIWEGPIQAKSFNVFRPKSTESERGVREFLGEANQGYWDIAARFNPEDN